MSDASSREDDLAAGIVGAIDYRVTEPELKDFKPWHKPRKQFVRHRQWSELLSRLFEQRPSSDPLRYLGLPGTDLIDLRYLYERICRGDNRPFRFLGFNSESQPSSAARIELDISLHEVRRLPNIDPRSDVIHDDFRGIGNPGSRAWRTVESLGPYDVVNIDLCDGLASDPPTIRQPIYDALARLFALQARNSTPWLLLITTRIGTEAFDADAEADILEHFHENARSCDGFIDECQRRLDLDALSIDHSACSQPEYLKLMIVALGKWLARLVQAPAASRVELASTLGYRVDHSAQCEDLVSLALRCEPVIAAPHNALSPTPPPPFDECKTAKRIVRRAAQRKNVDERLENNPDEFEGLIAEMEGLLTQARYDTEPYRAWLDSSDADND